MSANCLQCCAKFEIDYNNNSDKTKLMNSIASMEIQYARKLSIKSFNNPAKTQTHTPLAEEA